MNDDTILGNLVKENIITKEAMSDAILLPFKFGTVSMAYKTDTLIVPVGVTGDFTKHSNNLVTTFGKPIKVTSNLDKSNKELRESIKTLVLNNKRH